MSDIVERLRATITDMEFYEAPGEWLVPVEQAKAEIESLRTRLEVDPSHPYDGIYCRDETIRGLEKEIERLRAGGCARDQGTTQYCAEAAKLAAENERLRTALADPAVVHINMLAGVIAKPSPAQIIHIYGDDALRAALQANKPRRTLDELRGVFEEAYKDNREPRNG